ncbi:MAG: ATP-binding protein [Cyanobacteria bacterium P01_A01_bin.84]
MNKNYITIKKNIYESLKQENEYLIAELQYSQQLFQLLIDNIPHSVFWKDRNSVYLGCNQNFAKDAGIKEPKDITGKDDYDLPWTQEEAKFFRECDQRVMDNNTSEVNIIETQVQADGNLCWLDTNKIPLHDITGNVVGILGTYKNVTKQKQIEINAQQKAIELESTLQKLQEAQTQIIQTEKMTSLGQMVAGIAHEINNPTNFIHANLSFAKDYIQDLLGILELYQQNYPNPTEEIQEEIKNIELDYLKKDLYKILTSMQDGTRRIREIVLSLRNFSRLDEAELKEVDIHEGLESTLMILQHRLTDKSNGSIIEIIKDYDKLPLISCHPSQLNQVFLNIVANAIDALEERVSSVIRKDSFTPKIILSTKKINNKTAQISIYDNASGIPQNIISKLFDPFFTTKEVGKGTGLGLSVSYQIIVDKHGGKLFCNSLPDKGTSFIIEIPINNN